MSLIFRSSTEKTLHTGTPGEAYVKQVGVVTLLEIVKHSGLAEITQFAHVFHAIEFRRIHTEICLFILRLAFLLLCCMRD